MGEVYVMKRIGALLVFVSISALAAHAQIIDVKVPLRWKGDLAAVQLGTTWELTRHGVSVFDFGEDFEVWLTNYEVREGGNRRTISFLVSVRRVDPDTDERRPLGEDEVSFSYNDYDLEQGPPDPTIIEYVTDHFRFASNRFTYEAGTGGARVAEVLFDIVPSIMPPGYEPPR